MNLNKTLKSLAGEFAVLSQLALRGLDANMTLGNTKNVDILVSDPVKNKMYKLEVKTRCKQPIVKSRVFGNNFEWHMSKKHETIIDKNLFYCFVDISGDTNIFRFFIIPSKVVANYVKKEHQAYLKNNPKNKDNDMRMFRLAAEKRACIFPSIELAKYENNWGFKTIVSSGV